MVGKHAFHVFAGQGIVKENITGIKYTLGTKEWFFTCGGLHKLSELGKSVFLSEKDAIEYQNELFEEYTKIQQDRILRTRLEEKEKELLELERLLKKYPDEESRKLIIKDCSTCKHNIKYPPPHTCDVCTSLGQDEEYEMWEEKN